MADVSQVLTQFSQKEYMCTVFNLNILIGVGHYSYLWQFRNQEPKGNGTADISCVLTTTLTEAEQKEMDATNEEYR